MVAPIFSCHASYRILYNLLHNLSIPEREYAGPRKGTGPVVVSASALPFPNNSEPEKEPLKDSLSFHRGLHGLP